MKKINLAYLSYLTSPLNGGADIDDLVFRYYDFNSNDPEAIELIIEKVLKPEFDKFSVEFRQNAKDSLGFCLATKKIDLNNLFNGNLLPIEPPDNVELFYIRIWSLYFENEKYSKYNMEEYTDYYDSNEVVELLEREKL